MTRWKLTIEYDGSGFSGWQRQPHAPSVQAALEAAVLAFCGETVHVQGCGRTDAGVHALGQVAHVDIARPTNAKQVRDAINYYLAKKPVAVLQAHAVDETFHARFSARRRTYCYKIINRIAPLTFDKGRVTHIIRPLTLTPMQQGAAQLIGSHDFSTFRAQHCQAASPLKTMDAAQVQQQGDHFAFHFAARSFLYHQVRNMVGSLLLLGNGQWSLEKFAAAFAAKDRRQGGPTAPAQGLYFVGVDY